MLTTMLTILALGALLLAPVVGQRTAVFGRSRPGGLFSLVNEYVHPGNVIFVLASLGTNAAGYGDDPDAPVATIDYAVGLCEANKGDIIYVLPGHTEDVVAANGIDLDVAGISVIGVGPIKPVVTVKTLTTASVRINAADVLVRGLTFTAGTAQLLVKMIDVNADRARIEDCDLIGASTATFLVQSFVNIATTKDDTQVRRCRFIQGTDPAAVNAAAHTGAVYLVDSENVVIEDCEFRGNFETAFIHNKTTGAANLWVRRCYGICSLSDAVPFVLPAGCTGGADRCSMITPAEAATTEATYTGTFPAGFFNFQSYFGNDGGGGQNAIAVQAAAS